jgi:ribosome maturation factor RimP
MRFKQNRTEIENHIAEAVEACGYEFYGNETLSQKNGTLLRVYIDHPDGITLDDCEKASHQISALPEIENFFSKSYTLEVSSPGLDRPLFLAEHFERYIGKEVQLKLIVPQNNRKNYVGVISSVLDNQVYLKDKEEKMFQFGFEEIEKAKLVPVYEF